MKKTTPKLVEKKPIEITMGLGGVSKKIETDSVLETLRNLGVDETKIKSRMTLEIAYNGATLRRIYTIIQIKRMLANDITRKVISKYINSALGIPVDNYN